MTLSRGRRRLAAAMMTALLLAGCGDDAQPGPSTSVSPTIDTGSGTELTIPLGDRPFPLHVPDSYDPGQPVPLVVALHGFTSNATEVAAYFGLRRQSDQRGFLLALPEGTRDRQGRAFWNATDFCCNFGGSDVDDSAYLSGLINLVKASYSVDAVFLIGHSNGGFMAHRMACEHADQITAIATLAGVLWTNPDRCQPSGPVSVLHIHGTADATIDFDGTGGYPSAEETVSRWRRMDGCSEAADASAPALDLDTSVAGAETTVTTYADGCAGGTTVRFWRMTGSGHVPALSNAFTPAILDFLYAAAGLT